jgi:hypothetical protein
MPQIKKSASQPLQTNAVRLARVHFGYVAAYALFIVGADSWNLVEREVTSQRWLMCGVLLGVTAVVWYLSRMSVKNANYYRALIFAMVFVDIAIATFAVWTERGMSSRGVALYSIPIISSAVMMSRTAVFGTAALCTAAYFMTATRYFYVYFNEGYKIELYTTIGLYSAGFFILAALIWIVMSPGTSGKSNS